MNSGAPREFFAGGNNPPAEADSAARGHIIANMVLLVLSSVAGLLLLASTFFNVIMMAAGKHPASPSPSTAFEQGRLVGNAIGFGLTGLGSLACLLWGPINAWGLWTRRPWARTSTIVFWALSIPTLCCLPFGLYGLISLTRPSVARLFER